MKRWIILPLLAALLCGCQKQEVPAAAQPDMPKVTAGMPAPSYPEGKELFALADTEEEAQKIAGLYGVELVEFGNGVAVFHTEEDPLAVAQRGNGKDWPPLSVNYVENLTDPVGPETYVKTQ